MTLFPTQSHSDEARIPLLPNSLWPSDTIWRHMCEPTLSKDLVMDCYPLAPLPGAMLIYHRMCTRHSPESNARTSAHKTHPWYVFVDYTFIVAAISLTFPGGKVGKLNKIKSWACLVLSLAIEFCIWHAYASFMAIMYFLNWCKINIEWTPYERLSSKTMLVLTPIYILTLQKLPLVLDLYKWFI